MGEGCRPHVAAWARIPDLVVGAARYDMQIGDEETVIAERETRSGAFAFVVGAMIHEHLHD